MHEYTQNQVFMHGTAEARNTMRKYLVIVSQKLPFVNGKRKIFRFYHKFFPCFFAHYAQIYLRVA